MEVEETWNGLRTNQQRTKSASTAELQRSRSALIAHRQPSYTAARCQKTKASSHSYFLPTTSAPSAQWQGLRSITMSITLQYFTHTALPTFIHPSHYPHSSRGYRRSTLLYQYDQFEWPSTLIGGFHKEGEKKEESIRKYLSGQTREPAKSLRSFPRAFTHNYVFVLFSALPLRYSRLEETQNG